MPGPPAHVGVPPVHVLEERARKGGRGEELKEGLRIYWDFDKNYVSGSWTTVVVVDGCFGAR